MRNATITFTAVDNRNKARKWVSPSLEVAFRDAIAFLKTNQAKSVTVCQNDYPTNRIYFVNGEYRIFDISI